ncbi:hypothetical protein OHA10_06510 [Kribbella sp. NBC_00662]|uniref:hypothetical protein n=1 Tax=Kribbella sp. NBC_00662 TaxID=2975969 RepID=UPI00324FDBFB
MSAGGFDPFRPPMIGSRIWEETMTAAEWCCQCTGQCGRPHAKTNGRCGTLHGTAHRLAVVAADPLATLAEAVTATERLALCESCDAGRRRAAQHTHTTTAAAHAQPELIDLTGDRAA